MTGKFELLEGRQPSTIFLTNLIELMKTSPRIYSQNFQCFPRSPKNEMRFSSMGRRGDEIKALIYHRTHKTATTTLVELFSFFVLSSPSVIVGATPPQTRRSENVNQKVSHFSFDRAHCGSKLGVAECCNPIQTHPIGLFCVKMTWNSQ